MTIELAMRLSEILLGFALLQQSAEHLRSVGVEKIVAILRVSLSILLIVGIYPFWTESVLLITSILLIKHFRGPYNGGSDTMSILVLVCIWLAHLAPSRMWQEMALGYLALQVTLSYFQAGWVKVVNPEWRSGKALCEVFAFTAYPVSESLRALAWRPRLLFGVSWAVIIGELLFPLALVHSITLVIALLFAAFFHFSNALFLGLNRFFWSWLAAYPALIWLQQRLTG